MSACEVSRCQVQDLKSKIETRYRVRLILDNLPITTYDLERGPESVRPGMLLQPANCVAQNVGRVNVLCQHIIVLPKCNNEQPHMREYAFERLISCLYAYNQVSTWASGRTTGTSSTIT